MRRDKTLKSMSFKQVFFLICRGQNKPSVNHKQSQIVKRGWRIKEDQTRGVLIEREQICVIFPRMIDSMKINISTIHA